MRTHHTSPRWGFRSGAAAAALSLLAAIGPAAYADPPASTEGSDAGLSISGTVVPADPRLAADAFAVTALWADDAVVPGAPPPPAPVTVLADKAGDYIIEGLEPGVYFVRFEAVTAAGDTDPVFAIEYYADRLSLVDAVPVDLRSGPALDVDAELEANFSDVSDEPGAMGYSEFSYEIMWLAHEGITTGWPHGDATAQFRPFANVTRDAMAAFLYRAAGSPEVVRPEESPFSDVSPESSAFYDEIVWLSQQGISEGWTVGDGAEFRPFSPITRDAMAAFLYRFAEEPEYAAPLLSQFSDVSVDQPFYLEIMWLKESGISTGWKPAGERRQFRPYEPTTRDAMAAFLYRWDHLPAES